SGRQCQYPGAHAHDRPPTSIHLGGRGPAKPSPPAYSNAVVRSGASRNTVIGELYVAVNVRLTFVAALSRLAALPQRRENLVRHVHEDLGLQGRAAVQALGRVVEDEVVDAGLAVAPDEVLERLDRAPQRVGRDGRIAGQQRAAHVARVAAEAGALLVQP